MTTVQMVAEHDNDLTRPRGRRGITLVSGFLGSGKTTLLRRTLVGANSPADSLMVLNDIAGSFADDRLLADEHRDVRVVSQGCVCCTRLDKLLRVLDDELAHRPAGHESARDVVVETSGLADPAPIALAVAAHPMLRHHYEVTRICVTLDVLHGLLTLAEHPVAVRQLRAADEVVVTKTDLVSASTVDDVCRRVRGLNPSAEITVAVHGRRVRTFATTALATDGTLEDPAPAGTGNVVTVEFIAEEPLDWQRLAIWLSLLMHRYGDRVLRIKGAVEVQGAGHVALNAVRHVIHPPEHVSPTTRAGSQLVCIVQDIEPDVLRRSFDTFMAR